MNSGTSSTLTRDQSGGGERSQAITYTFCRDCRAVFANSLVSTLTITFLSLLFCSYLFPFGYRPFVSYLSFVLFLSFSFLLIFFPVILAHIFIHPGSFFSLYFLFFFFHSPSLPHFIHPSPYPSVSLLPLLFNNSLLFRLRPFTPLREIKTNQKTNNIYPYNLQFPELFPRSFRTMSVCTCVHDHCHHHHHHRSKERCRITPSFGKMLQKSALQCGSFYSASMMTRAE